MVEWTIINKNKMHRCWSMLLALFFLYNSIGTVILFPVKQSLIKENRKGNKIESVDITIIKTPVCLESAKINWLEEDEFTFQERLYDLVGKKVINDSLYLYAKIDDEEFELISELKDFINEQILQTDSKTKNTKTTNSLKSKIQDSLCEEYTVRPNFNNAHYIRKTTSRFISNYRSIHSEILAPPPQNQFIKA